MVLAVFGSVCFRGLPGRADSRSFRAKKSKNLQSTYLRCLLVRDGLVLANFDSSCTKGQAKSK